jgi:hypothetical protein
MFIVILWEKVNQNTSIMWSGIFLHFCRIFQHSHGLFLALKRNIPSVIYNFFSLQNSAHRIIPCVSLARPFAQSGWSSLSLWHWREGGGVTPLHIGKQWVRTYSCLYR